MRCWGANDAGQLGDGTTTGQLMPVFVDWLTKDVTATTASRRSDSTSGDTLGYATSTTTTTTATSTTTTTLAGCDGVPAGPTFASIDCRLASSITALRVEPALGTLAPELTHTLGYAREYKRDAEVLCARTGAKAAGNRLRQAAHKMTRYIHQLRGRHARERIPAAVRDPLVAAGQSIRSDLRRLRQGLNCL